MTPVWSAAACVTLGYVCGSLPWGLWLGWVFRGVDVRTMGSRNLGATNVFRSLGRGLGLATLVLDILKGAAPVWIVPQLPLAAAFPGGQEACALSVGFAAIAGHVWTFLAGFKGGKGVATTAGVLLALAPLAFGVSLGVFVVTVAVTRFISLGSILGAVAFTVTFALIARGGASSPTFAFALVVALLVIGRHKDNIRRLRDGTERRFDWNRGGQS